MEGPPAGGAARASGAARPPPARRPAAPPGGPERASPAGGAALQPGGSLWKQPGLAREGAGRAPGAGAPPAVLLRGGHALRGAEAGAAALPLRAPGLAGALPAGPPRGAPLRRQRPRPLHPSHGLHHLSAGGWAGAGHAESVLPRPVGLAGQLRPGLAHRGGAGRSAWPLPCGCPYCTDPHRPGRLLRLQICGHDCRPLGRASVWEAWLLHAAQLVLCHHLCLYDPFAAPEDPVRGNQRGPEAGHPEPSTHVPDHGCGWAAAPPHVLADLSPHLLMLCSGSCFVPPTSTHHFQPAPSPRPPWLHRRQSRANGHFRALIHSTLVLLWVGGACQFTLLPP